MSPSGKGGCRVLIVEDDAALREALSDALRDEGFSVAAIVASHCGAPEGGL